MAITAEQVKQLRDKTGAGMMECKAALTEANGDMEEAVTILRKRGLAQAAKRAGRATAQGTVGTYIHLGGRIGVMVEVNCESDFVARTDDFNNLVKEVAMHIAAADPKWVRREDVPADAIEKEKSIYRAQMANSGKPDNVLEKIIEGKLGSFYSQFVLLDQPSVRDGAVTISQLVVQPALPSFKLLPALSSPRSQASPSSTSPLPHSAGLVGIFSQSSPASGHFQPASIVQLPSQPSPGLPLLSSHVSGASTSPSPHTGPSVPPDEPDSPATPPASPSPLGSI